MAKQCYQITLRKESIFSQFWSKDWKVNLLTFCFYLGSSCKYEFKHCHGKILNIFTLLCDTIRIGVKFQFDRDLRGGGGCISLISGGFSSWDLERKWNRRCERGLIQDPAQSLCSKTQIANLNLQPHLDLLNCEVPRKNTQFISRKQSANIRYFLWR